LRATRNNRWLPRVMIVEKASRSPARARRSRSSSGRGAAGAGCAIVMIASDAGSPANVPGGGCVGLFRGLLAGEPFFEPLDRLLAPLKFGDRKEVGEGKR